MKIRLSLIFIILSIFFLSCGNSISQEGEGIITLDAGKVARYLGQNVTDAHSAISRSGMPFLGRELPDIKSYMFYEMNIKVSTIGKYETSSEMSYKKSMTDIISSTDMEAAKESFYREATGTPITLDGIPVGATIKVQVELSFGQTFDEENYRHVLSAESINAIEEELELVKSELENEYKTVKAVSETFTVQKGENKVTLHLDKPEYFGVEPNGFDIILYTNLTDSSTGNGIWLYKSKNANTKLFTRHKYVSNEFTDFTVSSDGTVFYNKGNTSDNRHFYKINPKRNATEQEITLNDILYIEKLYVDEDENILFYGCNDENYYFIDSCPLVLSGETVSRNVRKPGSNDDYEFCRDPEEDLDPENYVHGFFDIFDFAVELGEKDETENEGLRTITYENSAIYLAAYRQEGESTAGYLYDICFIKLPMTYTIEQLSGNELNTTMLIDDGNFSFLYLSDVNEMFASYKYGGVYEQYPYSITDMTVRNGTLYALVSTRQVSPDKGWFDDNHFSNEYEEYPCSYLVHSYGMILKIDLSTFDSSDVQMFGYDSNNNVVYEIAQMYNGTPTENIISFNVRQPASDNAPYFFGPRKFIAIKPDELVIADDGTFYYKSGNDFCYKNEDRVVIFNTTTNELTAYQLNMASEVKFEKNETNDKELEIQGCNSSTPAAPCKYRP